MAQTTYTDYPKRRLATEHTNDDLVCVHCLTPAKQIQDRLEGHKPDCKYVAQKRAG